MFNRRTVLLVDDNPAHAKAFREVLLDADGPFEGNRAESTRLILNTLKSVGVRLTADDCGTRYSSFSYLKRFLIDSLNINLSFVRDSHPGGATVPIVDRGGPARLLNPAITSFIPRPRLKGASATSPWLIPDRKHLHLN
jgi:hypothetical protein